MLVALAACLCSQIEADGGDKPCFCGVVPGDMAIADYAQDCGGDTECGDIGWSRLVTLYPAKSPGIQDQQLGNCRSGLGIDIELGIMRCMAVGESDGSAPPPAEIAAATDQQTRDAMTMWRALQCCDILPTSEFRVGSYTPMGPMGGYVGGTFTVYVAI